VLFQGDPQQLVHFFLERDDRLRFGELLLELARTPLEFDFTRAGLRSWSGTATPGRESLDAVLA